MKRRILLILVGLVLALNGRIIGQETTLMVKILILDQLPYQHSQPILEIVQQNLAQSQINLEERFVTTFDEIALDSATFEQFQPSLTIAIQEQVTLHQEEKRFHLFMRSYQPTSLEPSPILYAQVGGEIWGDFDAVYTISSLDAWVDIQTSMASLVTAMGLYSIERCDLALPYFDDDFLSLISVPYILPYINFYHGNCAIVEEDLETARDLLRPNYMGLDFNFERHFYPQGLNYAWVRLQGIEEDLVQYPQLESPFYRLVGGMHPDLRGKDFADFLARRAQLHALAFEYDLAIADMDDAIRFVEDRNQLTEGTFLPNEIARFYVLRGQMVMLLYEWDRVLADYNTALELDPTYADAYFYRGVLYYSVLEREQASADFERYIELAPEGDHAAEAARYVESIRIELGSLDG